MCSRRRSPTGFALAVQPVAAQTITTDTAGLEAGEVKITTADGEIPAYRAMPRAGGPFPVVLVVQEIFGVHEHIKDVCRRLAKLGYLAVAPELYARQGDVSKLTDIEEIRQIVGKVPDAQVMSDLDATVAWAKGIGKGDTSRLGDHRLLLGRADRLAVRGAQPDVKAGVAWYGRLVGETRPSCTPKYPIDVAAELKAPVLGLYGGADQGIPVETVEKMRAACKAAGKTCRDRRLPGRPARLLRRLPPELPGSSRRTAGRVSSPGSRRTASPERRSIGIGRSAAKEGARSRVRSLPCRSTRMPSTNS